MTDRATEYDAIVIGGGPAGATGALVMARRGLRVLVLEKSPHPRFHIGESFLPRNMTLIEELGLGPALAAIPQVAKHGAEFAMGNAQSSRCFRFDEGMGIGGTATFNIERAPFDNMVLRAAAAAGAEVVEGPAATVKEILELADGSVAVQTPSGVRRARCLLDASGQSTVIGKHLGTRRVLPHLRKVAYFGHFHNVDRAEGDVGGFPTIVMCEEGWFWAIPIDKERTSIGLVLDGEAARRVQAEFGVAPTQMLAWAIPRCPFLWRRASRATFPEANGVTADFSYRCEPYAGPGYFLVGDAATFVDPIFSTGVCLGMMSGKLAAESVADITQSGADPATERTQYIKYVSDSSSVFFDLVYKYYDHAFRELFLEGTGPLSVHRAVISTLAGNVFPRPVWSLRWRLRFFGLLIRIHRRRRLVAARGRFSLLESADPARASERPSPEVRIAAAAAGLGAMSVEPAQP